MNITDSLANRSLVISTILVGLLCSPANIICPSWFLLHAALQSKVCNTSSSAVMDHSRSCAQLTFSLATFSYYMKVENLALTKKKNRHHLSSFIAVLILNIFYNTDRDLSFSQFYNVDVIDW